MATHTSREVPGEATQMGTSLVDTASAAIQGFGPINKIHQHLCAFHFYGDDMTRQVEAHHFCAHQNEEMRQCLIYDGPDANARLIGLEYLVSENLFSTLPDDEKPMWHSHEYEVKSGVLFMPGFPLGLPQVMMALTRDGQLYDHLKADVEKRYDVSFEEERAKRGYMKGPEHGIHPLANGGGNGMKLVIKEVDCNPLHHENNDFQSVPRVFV